MTTAPAAVHAAAGGRPPGPDLDLTPLLGADGMTAVVVVLIALVVGRRGRGGARRGRAVPERRSMTAGPGAPDIVGRDRRGGDRVPRRRGARGRTPAGPVAAGS